MRFGFHSGDALVHSQALILFRDVFGGDADIQAEVELCLGGFDSGFALHLADGALEHLGVEFEADGFDVAALLAAQQIAGAAQFEIERGDFEARAQIGKFLQRRQPAARDRRELDFGGHQQIGVGAAIGAAHASAKLVKLGEAQAVGAIDDDGVARAGYRGRFR